MLLTDADKTKISEWLNAKCGKLRCICCGHGQWSLIDMSGLSIGFDVHSTRFHYHEGVPFVSIVCLNCAHLVHFSTAVMGFKPDVPPPADIPAPGA